MGQVSARQSVAQWFLIDAMTKNVRLTVAGRAHLSSAIARFGYDRNGTFSQAEFRRIIDERFAARMRAFAGSERRRDADLDAILSGLPGWEE